MANQEKNKFTTYLVLATGIAVLAFVFWPEKNNNSQNPAFGQSPQLKGSRADSQIVAKPQNDRFLGKPSSEVQEPVQFELKNPANMNTAERDMLRRVEEGVDSVIQYPALREKISPRVERLIKAAFEKYKSPYFSGAYADFLFVNRKFDEAVKQYKKAYPAMKEIDGFRANYARASNASATLKAGQGDFASALNLFELTQELQPNYPNLDSSLFMCYAQDAYTKLNNDEAKLALKSINKGLQIDSSRFAMNFYAGKAYLDSQVNQAAKAVVFLERCKKLMPSHVDTRQLLFNAYQSLGDMNAAGNALIK